MISINGFELNKSLFMNTKLNDLISSADQHHDCVMIDCNAQVDKALELMVTRGISSLPVKDQDGKIMGLLSMSDIVAHMSGYVQGPGEDPTQRDIQEHRHLAPKKDMNALNLSCSHLLGLTRESRFYSVVNADEPLHQVLPKLSNGSHRALVHGHGWWQVISQWDIAVWLADHSRELDALNLANDRRQWLGSIVNANIGDIGLAQIIPVLTLSCDITAMEGFSQIAHYGASAMPIVANNGTLCGTLSVGDLRGLDQPKLKSLSLPIMEFLKLNNLYQFPQVVANKHMTFGDLLLRIQARNVHRLWIVDRINKPCGVVSLTDILHALDRWIHDESPKMLTASLSPAAPERAMMENFDKKDQPLDSESLAPTAAAPAVKQKQKPTQESQQQQQPQALPMKQQVDITKNKKRAEEQQVEEPLGKDKYEAAAEPQKDTTGKGKGKYTKGKAQQTAAT